MVRVADPVPLAARATLLGETVQPGWYAALVVVSEQVRETVPAKLFNEASARLTVFPEVAPEVKLRDVVPGVIEKVGDEVAPTVTVTVAYSTVVPLVPVTTTLSVPADAPGVTVSTALPVPFAARVTGLPTIEQVPVALPLFGTTLQVKATLPAKLFSEVSVRPSVAALLTAVDNVPCAGPMEKLERPVNAVTYLATSSDPQPVDASQPAVTR